jgi:predicted CXXCH cytochrome family protein
LTGHRHGCILTQLMKSGGYSAVISLLFLLVPAVFAASGPSRDSACLKCHSGEVYRTAESGQKEMVKFSSQELRNSVHRGVACLDCHKGISTLPHEKRPGKVDCAGCHEEAQRAFAKSLHGMSFKKGDKDAPYCTTCHGKHGIRASGDARSLVSRELIVGTCLRCHTDVDIEKRHGLPSPDVIKAYDSSVHGKILKEGKPVRVAACTDCHGSHLIAGPDDRDSSMYKANIPAVCGKCHVQIYNEYKVSIHAKSLSQGKLESPACTDCHGEHTLTVVKDPGSKVYAKNIPATCAKCHEDQRIIAKYGLPSGRYASYIGSFHGVAVKYGNVTVANCTSCHEAHRILPSSDSASSVNKTNLPKTCGKCHPQLKAAAFEGKMHVEASKESSPGMYYVRSFYTWFIGILMLLFVSYIAIDVYGRIKRKGRRNG